ncbi:MAG: inorganic phosphate transporter [Magnetococcales bacterium]|nr:inorganic phosphate transporter [Magnetococcales bacterium]
MEAIAEYGPVLMTLAMIFGLYMTWGIGANDVANAMGTSVGSGAITVKQAIIISAIFEFGGAVLAGGTVTETIRVGIIDTTTIVDRPETLVFGMLAALLASAIWLMIASARGWPVSTTHSIVGALVGFSMAGIGIHAVHWNVVSEIVVSWVISPLVGGIIAFLLMLSIRSLILNTESPFKQAKKWGPAYVFLVGFITSLITMFKGMKHLDIHMTTLESVLLSILIGLLVMAVGKVLINRVEVDEEADRDFYFASVEKVFTPLMLFTACAMAFAHGSNDVANGVGPLSAVVSIVQSGGQVAQMTPLDVNFLILGGVGIVIGIATMGYRVMQTIGTKITELTPTRGFCATLGAACTVVLASKTGLPVSTTHVAVGAVMGVGLARGIGAIDLRVIGGIIVSWVITLPAGGLLAAMLYFTLKGIFS